jgi:deoxyribodipyrimidine photo-lyase
MSRPPKQPRRETIPTDEQPAYDTVVKRFRAWYQAGEAPPEEHFEVGTYFGALLNSPPMCALASQMGAMFRDVGNKPGSYSHADREFVDQVLAAEYKSNVVQNVHIIDAVKSGVRIEAVEALRARRDDLLTEDELLLAKYIRQVIKGKVTDDYKRWSSLPDWARATLTKHADDERPFVYTKAQLEDAETHDEIWNAAQTQLRREGVIHNYLRMLWGKKILHWTRSPRTALDVMLELNDRYALDGRDPNSYSGIFWTLGRHDRPWGPEREVFGTVRYMSSDSTRRKLHVNEYVRRYGAQGSLFDG